MYTRAAATAIGMLVLLAGVSAPTYANPGRASQASTDKPFMSRGASFDRTTGIGEITISLQRNRSNTDDGIRGSIKHTVRDVYLADKPLAIGKTRRLPGGMKVTRTTAEDVLLQLQTPARSYTHWHLLGTPVTSCTYAGVNGGVFDCWQARSSDAMGQIEDWERVKTLQSRPGLTWGGQRASARFKVVYDSKYIRRGKSSEPGYWDCSIYYREVCKWIPRKPSEPGIRREVRPLTLKSTLGIQVENDFRGYIGTYDSWDNLDNAKDRGYLVTVNGIYGQLMPAVYDEEAGMVLLPSPLPSGIRTKCDVEDDDCYFPNILGNPSFTVNPVGHAQKRW